MNNKAEALRNLSVPAFEVRNTPEADEAARRLCAWSLPEAVPCLSPAMVTSVGLVVLVQMVGEICPNCFSKEFAETLGQIVSSSCLGAWKLTQGIARGTPEDTTDVGISVFPCLIWEAPCHHPRPEAQLSLACFNGPTQPAPSLFSKRRVESNFWDVKLQRFLEQSSSFL